MPYAANEDLPPSVRNRLPVQAQDIFREAFNHAFDQYAGDETVPFRIAWAAFHTLGAEDKYDGRGKALVPLGLAERDRRPPFPQRFTEIMARNRPIDADHEVPPDGIDDVVVGPTTAREIGWSR